MSKLTACSFDKNNTKEAWNSYTKLEIKINSNTN